MSIKQLSVFVENKPGRLAEITETIAAKGVNIRALSISDTTEFGILRLIVSDPEAAVAALKEAGFTVSLTEVLAILIDDEPGGFCKALKVLNAAEIAIGYVYAFTSRTDGKAFVLVHVEDIQRAVEVLSTGGVSVAKSTEVYGM
ncbi:MAG: ACT domain-containing protein [Ruminococcaceae bacterium]|nr:ACT domain-containing protein [Oscillospiraceae bacterium]